MSSISNVKDVLKYRNKESLVKITTNTSYYAKINNLTTSDDRKRKNR